MVVESMVCDKLSYKETTRQHDIPCDKQVAEQEEIYRIAGPEELCIECCGRSSKGCLTKYPKKGVKQSMSRTGNRYSNSITDNFFGHLKNELHYLEEAEFIECFKAVLIEHSAYYNNRRIRAKLKGLPPALHR